MSLIDWSDPEEMLGLLTEYVADEAAAERDDRDRAAFLRELSRALQSLERGLASVDGIEPALRDIRDAQPTEFAGDPVMVHVEACIEELQRIAAGDTDVYLPPAMSATLRPS
jgi:hypothetical protein